MDKELPEGSPIWRDERGVGAAESAEGFVRRTLLETHPEATAFVACLANNNLISRDFVSRSGGSLLFAAASLVGATRDPTALLSGLLALGAPVDITFGSPSSSTSSPAARAARFGNETDKNATTTALGLNSAESMDGYNILHKVIGRDKVMLDDATTRLLQPPVQPPAGASSNDAESSAEDDAAAANSQFAQYFIYLSALADSVASKLAGSGLGSRWSDKPTLAVAAHTAADHEAASSLPSPGSASSAAESLYAPSPCASLEVSEPARIRAAMRSLIADVEVYSSTHRASPAAAGDNATADPVRQAPSSSVIGRRVSHAALQTLSNGLAQVSILTLIEALRARSNSGSTSGSGLASSSPLLALVSRQDKYGRNPIHAAVMTDNAGAILMLLQELRRTVIAHTAATGGQSSAAASPGRSDDDGVFTMSLDVDVGADGSQQHDRSTAASGAALDPLAQILSAMDIFGYTPRELAVVMGQRCAVEVLREAEITAGLLTQTLAAEGSDRSSGGAGGKRVKLSRDREGLLHRSVTDASNSAVAASESSGNDATGGWTSPAFVPNAMHAAVDAANDRLRGVADATAARTDKPSDAGMYDVCQDIDVIDFRCRDGYDDGSETTAECIQRLRSNSSGFTASDFLRGYFVPHRPVLLKGIGSHWPIRDAWAKDALLSKQGDVTVSASSIPNAAAVGGTSKQLSLRQHVHAMLGCTLEIGSGDAVVPAEMREAGVDRDMCRQYAGSASSTASSYVYNRITAANHPSQPAASSATSSAASLSLLVDDMTILPWFMDISLPTRNATIGVDDQQQQQVSASYHEPLMQPYPHPPSPHFYSGGPGTGSPVLYHSNSEVWNTLVHGRKLWMLQHPSDAEDSTVPIHLYATHVLGGFKGAGEIDAQGYASSATGHSCSGSASSASPPSSSAPSASSSQRHGPKPPAPSLCVQEGGDVMYVPRGWGHGVLHLETVVGYAVEFHSPLERY